MARSIQEEEPSPGRVFRPDIEGLRAVAILLVVAFHAGVPGITGGYIGVDVFYVVSGFLITGLLIDELQRTGSISFPSFYARRVRRLLPMAALVLVAVAIGMEFFTPPVFRPTVRFDAISAAFYYSNWQYSLESRAWDRPEGRRTPTRSVRETCAKGVPSPSAESTDVHCAITFRRLVRFDADSLSVRTCRGRLGWCRRRQRWRRRSPTKPGRDCTEGGIRYL